MKDGEVVSKAAQTKKIEKMYKLNFVFDMGGLALATCGGQGVIVDEAVLISLGVTITPLQCYEHVVDGLAPEEAIMSELVQAVRTWLVTSFIAMPKASLRILEHTDAEA